jgi:hypothetical protein|mmetsp:Transcript_52554/g.87738  ORF Transcript_52554/g.87738 Transcript_52554/m.87738 type:complete len:181 (-) Transcript_52554:849-1391(-)
MPHDGWMQTSIQNTAKALHPHVRVGVSSTVSLDDIFTSRRHIMAFLWSTGFLKNLWNIFTPATRTTTHNTTRDASQGLMVVHHSSYLFHATAPTPCMTLHLGALNGIRDRRPLALALHYTTPTQPQTQHCGQTRNSTHYVQGVPLSQTAAQDSDTNKPVLQRRAAALRQQYAVSTGSKAT